VGMLIGGGITALGSPRTALAVASAGSLAVTVTAWLTMARLGVRTERPTVAHSEAGSDPPRAGPRLDTSRTPAVRHQ
jgi:hypothetical protein